MQGLFQGALQGPIKGLDSSNAGSSSFGGIPRGRSPVPKASHNAGKDIENTQAPESPARAEQSSYPQYGGHYGMPGIPPQAEAMAATAAASGGGYAPNNPRPAVQRVRSRSPTVGSGILQRARSPLSPHQQNSQLSMPAKQAQSPQSAPGTEAETPLYVNAKQFHRILKRRVARQRLEEAWRLTSKGRKSYLNESRHSHPMRRPRRPGGRFLAADEFAERMGFYSEVEHVLKPAGDASGYSDSEKTTTCSDSRAGRGLPVASVAKEPASVREEHISEIGTSLSGAYHTDARGRALVRSRSLSLSRSTVLGEWTRTMAPRSKSAGASTNIEIIGGITRSSSSTDEEDIWSSEEEATPEAPKLSGDQRNSVERVMETFWDVMNKNWRSYIRERTTASSTAGASSADGSSQQTSSGASTGLDPSQKSLGKRPANDDGRDNEERLPKRNRNDSTNKTDASERIKLSCPYRKRNKRKYNVYTHRTCALSGFPDIARVKEHLYRTHRAPIQCHRCALMFKDQQELKTHSRAMTSCELKEGETVEGFDNDIYDKLKRRKKSTREQPVEARWREIYFLLFSDDDQDYTPSPFWEPPVDEPAPSTIAIEDYIRQEVPHRVRMHIEDWLAAEDYSYNLTLVLSNQMMEIFEAQIESCILEHRAKVRKESQQKTDPPTPPISSSRSPAVSAEQPATDSYPLSTPVPQTISGVPEDWFAPYLLPGDAPWDSLLPFPPDEG